jgi:hypothetical protein
VPTCATFVNRSRSVPALYICVWSEITEAMKGLLWETVSTGVDCSDLWSAAAATDE